MRTLPALLLTSLFLTACGNATVSYSLAFDVTDAGKKAELIESSLNMMQRRLENLQSTLVDQSIENGTGGTILTITVPSKEVADELSLQLVQPFVLQVMKEAPAGSGAIAVEGHGSFVPTGVEAKHFVWVEHAQDNEGKGALRLILSPEGRTLMSQIFTENVNKSIGIFVRGRLISKLSVKSPELKDDLIIRNIPNSEIAEIFADDVNVGIHVTFTPLP